MILTDPTQFAAVNDALVEAGYNFSVAQTGYLPKNTVTIQDPENIKHMETLIDIMEDDDDVQDVYTNWEQE